MRYFIILAITIMFMGCTSIFNVKLPDRQVDFTGSSLGTPLATAYSNATNLELEVYSVEFGMGKVETASIEVSTCDGSLDTVIGRRILGNQSPCTEIKCTFSEFLQSGSYLRINASCDGGIAKNRGDVYLVYLNYTSFQNSSSGNFVIGACRDENRGLLCNNTYGFLLQKS